MWQLFRKRLKTNSILFFGIFFFNFLATCLEGISFAFLLMGIATLSGEIIQHPLFVFFKQWSANSFFIFLAAAILLQIIRALSAYFGQVMMTFLTINIQTQAQKEIYKRIFHMSYSEVAAHKKGDLMHQATAPPSFIPLLFDEYNRFLISSLMIAAYVCIMMKISLPLTTVTLSFFFLIAIAQRYLLGKITKASHEHAEYLTDLSKETAQSLDGLKSVHIFQKQRYTLTKMYHHLRGIAHATLRLKKLNASIPALNECLGVVCVGFSLLAGSYFLYHANAPFTSYLFTYLTLTYRLGMRLQHVMIACGTIAYHSGLFKRLKQMLTKQLDSAEISSLRAVQFEEAIQFEEVSFQYPNSQSFALKNISISIPKNQVIALVGMSGAGKTSLIDLILRLYTPSQGRIKIDGQEVNTYTLSKWRHLFGVVCQNPFLFHASIEENIRFGKADATQEEILHAAKASGADIFIQKLPQKYQTILGDKGYRLSGGEKQRIALAQALVRNPDVLILDEATSHLDSCSEQLIQHSLQSLRHKKTFLIVAHRLSTIQMADLIYVLDNGSIIEKGTHQDLLHLGGRYHLFWHLQTCESVRRRR